MAGILESVHLQFAEFSFVVILLGTAYSVYTLSGGLYLACMVSLYICLKAIKLQSAKRVDPKQKGVFITGCDTGFGHDLARKLDELGFTVFAGCLKPEGDGARKLVKSLTKRLHVVPLDVGSDDSVEQAREYVKKHLPKEGLWAIVSNAGFNILGDVEFVTLPLYKKAMNVNYYGAIRTIRNFLYMVRKNKGRVVIVSSVRGISSWPTVSAYTMTKHGLECMADCLRLEMRKFGVNVSIIEPGNYSNATECQNESHFKRYEQEAEEMWEAASDDVRATYGRRYLDALVARQKIAVAGGGLTTAPVVDAMVDAIMSGRPDTRYMIDGGFFDIHATLARYYEYLPTWLTDFIIAKITGCDKFPDYKKLKLE